MKITLSKPIKAHGQDVSELELREPRGGDIRKCGMPFNLSDKPGGGTDVQYNTDNIAKYVSELAAIPMSSVDLLSVSDFKQCLNAVMDFFRDETPGTA